VDSLNGRISKISALETYNQAVRHFHIGRVNRDGMALASSHQKPRFTSSDSHNYYCLQLETSGMLIAKHKIEYGAKDNDSFIDCLTAAIKDDKLLHYQTGSLKDYLGYLKIANRNDWHQVIHGERRKSMLK
jgi:hypothetical protein